MRKHILIPDGQVKDGVALDHWDWVGEYLVEKEPDVVVEIGDFADCYSLNSYDKGKMSFEGAKYKGDVESVKKALEKLWTPLFNSKHYDKCETHHLDGNHEHRVTRFVENNSEFEGIISIEDFGFQDWYDYTHGFLDTVEIDGLTYCHYFYNHRTGRAWGGNIITRLKNIGFSFVMSHQQGLDYGMIPLGNGKTHYGMVAGSCYLHDEHYMGPQAQHHWRGIVVLHEVREGMYDPMFVSLDYLCRKYEGMEIKQFLKKKYGRVDGYTS